MTVHARDRLESCGQLAGVPGSGLAAIGAQLVRPDMTQSCSCETPRNSRTSSNPPTTSTATNASRSSAIQRGSVSRLPLALCRAARRAAFRRAARSALTRAEASLMEMTCAARFSAIDRRPVRQDQSLVQMTVRSPLRAQPERPPPRLMPLMRARRCPRPEGPCIERSWGRAHVRSNSGGQLFGDGHDQRQR